MAYDATGPGLRKCEVCLKRLGNLSPSSSGARPHADTSIPKGRATPGSVKVKLFARGHLMMPRTSLQSGGDDGHAAKQQGRSSSSSHGKDRWVEMNEATARKSPHKRVAPDKPRRPSSARLSYRQGTPIVLKLARAGVCVCVSCRMAKSQARKHWLGWLYQNWLQRGRQESENIVY